MTFVANKAKTNSCASDFHPSLKNLRLENCYLTLKNIFAVLVCFQSFQRLQVEARGFLGLGLLLVLTYTIAP